MFGPKTALRLQLEHIQRLNKSELRSNAYPFRSDNSASHSNRKVVVEVDASGVVSVIRGRSSYVTFKVSSEQSPRRVLPLTITDTTPA